MKHAGSEALDQLEDVLEDLRGIDGLVEKKRGVFYRRSRAFLHFHEDPSGLYADVRLDREFERLRVATKAERRTLLSAVRREVSAAPGDEGQQQVQREPEAEQEGDRS
ncbi:MAG: hypothetical protein O7A09_02430 [Proteobacteria bacterium]|nr:hypothetical protein [Pseudomonadota bacterium]